MEKVQFKGEIFLQLFYTIYVRPEKSLLIGKLIDLTRKCNDKLFSEQPCPYQALKTTFLHLLVCCSKLNSLAAKKKSCDRINKIEDTVLKAYGR